MFFAIDEKMIHISKDVKVQSNGTTDMGTVSFCTTVDADAVKQDLKSIIQLACPPDSKEPQCADDDKDGAPLARRNRALCGGTASG